MISQSSINPSISKLARDEDTVEQLSFLEAGVAQRKMRHLGAVRVRGRVDDRKPDQRREEAAELMDQINKGKASSAPRSCVSANEVTYVLHALGKAVVAGLSGTLELLRPVQPGDGLVEEPAEHVRAHQIRNGCPAARRSVWDGRRIAQQLPDEVKRRQYRREVLQGLEVHGGILAVRGAGRQEGGQEGMRDRGVDGDERRQVQGSDHRRRGQLR